MLAKLVILLIPFVCGFFNSVPVHCAFKFSRNGTVELMQNITKRNLSDTPAACHLKINQSTINELLILTRQRGKNAIKLNVWMESVNNTLNKTLFLPEIIWANKMGRTLVSLIAQAENSPRMMLSSYTSTLTAGVDGVDVVISEAPKGCLLPGKNTADIVFYFLLHQLHVIDEEKKYFQLCSRKLKNETQFNCCGLNGQASRLICSEFSTLLADIHLYLATLLCYCLFVNLIVKYLDDSHAESEYYKISDSPMSLLSIIRIAFILRDDPLKSFGRRLVFTSAVLVTVLPDWDRRPATYVIYVWASMHLFFDFPFFTTRPLRHEICDDNSALDREYYSNSKLLRMIALPFNLKFFWNGVNQSSFFQKHFKLSINIQQSTSNTEITECTVSLRLCREWLRRRLEILKYCLSIVFLLILYVIAIPIKSLGVLGKSIFGHLGLVWSSDSYPVPYRFPVHFPMNIIAFVSVLFSVYKCLLFTYFFSTGLYLNGQFYRSSFLPLFIVLFYSWFNWRTSIEAKYVELITKIYEVCRESVPLQITENNTNDISGSTSTPKECFKILLDDNGEPIIEKQLYDIIRERFLPYDEFLLCYFGRVFLMTIFNVFLHIVLSTAETSGLSSVVLIINTMVTTSLPLLVGVIWNTCSDEQKAANSLALKTKLEKILVVHSYNKGEIMLEVTNRGTQGEVSFGKPLTLI